MVGEAPALKSKENMLLQELNSLTIECLPGQILSSVVVDISPLTEAEQAILVKDIILGEEIAVLNDPEHIVVKVISRPVEKVEEVVEAPEEAPLTEEESKEE